MKCGALRELTAPLFVREVRWEKRGLLFSDNALLLSALKLLNGLLWRG